MKSPFVFGLPGLLCADDPSRIDKLLQILRSEGIPGKRINFSSVQRESEKKIRCTFSLEAYVQDISQAFEEILQNPEIDAQHIGVIASSISALFMGYYLRQQPKSFLPKAYATISPLPGWNYFVTPRVRERLLTNPEGINLSSPRDKERGIKRHIAAEGKEAIQRADALKILKKFDNRRCAILTILGTQDTISNQGAMREYHTHLGGKRENLLVYEAEHDVPQALYQEKMKKFFRKNLLE